MLLSDLHNKVYGTKNDKVIEAIRRINPDFIVLAGDLVTSQLREDMTPGIELLRTLRQDYREFITGWAITSPRCGRGLTSLAINMTG